MGVSKQYARNDWRVWVLNYIFFCRTLELIGVWNLFFHRKFIPKQSTPCTCFCKILLINNRKRRALPYLNNREQGGAWSLVFICLENPRQLGILLFPDCMSQILATNENSKSKISLIVWDGRGQIWRIRSVSIFPTRPRFLWWLAIILTKWKLKFVPSGTLAMDFAHYQLSKLLGSRLPITDLCTNFNLWHTFHFPSNSISRESRTDFWWLSDTSVNCEMVGKK